MKDRDEASVLKINGLKARLY